MLSLSVCLFSVDSLSWSDALVTAGMVLLLAPHLHQHRLLLLSLTSSLLHATPLLFLPLLPCQS